MSERTAIAWTDHTFNPWWGCTKLAHPDGSGCDHCYAATFAKRTGHDVWGKDGARRFFGDKHWAEPLKWNLQAEENGRRHRVFCASMADVFEVHPELPTVRTRLFELVEATPCLDWQLLTKRPENVPTMAARWMDNWPAHVWIGTTVEHQASANLRVPRLLQVPAAVRFLSCEPLLGPVLLAPWLHEGIGWVIAGGESGAGYRPLDLEHARVLRDECDECEEAGVPFFFKQVGGFTPTAGGDLLDSVVYKQFPASVRAS